MDIKDLEVFLKIKDTSSISATASMLFISQSTVSRKLQMLEEELGIQLFIRNRGYSQTLLSADGYRFVPIAEKILELYSDAQLLRDSIIRTRIDIACVDSVNYFLAPFIRDTCTSNPTLDIHLRTNHSWEIHGMIENREVDIGIANDESPYSDSDSIFVFSENYVVARQRDADGKNCVKYVHPRNLNPRHEIYQSFSSSYNKWHTYWWKPGQAKIEVLVASLIETMFSDTEDWAILPESITKILPEGKYVFSQLENPPPARKCYLILPKLLKGRNSTVIMSLANSLVDYFNKLSVKQ